MSDTLDLFDPGPYTVEQPDQAEPGEPPGADARRTRRQADLIGRGCHPLSLVIRAPILLHPDAPRVTSRDEPGDGPRCGTCRFRVHAHWHGVLYPKCAYGIEKGQPLDNAPFATHGSASDVRRWWPGCRHHEPREETAGE